MIASFNRPYDGDGSGQFRYMEYPLLKLAEKAGLDLNYVTDFELDSGAVAITNTHTLILSGHAEYWTSSMRENVERLVNSGINLISLGANSIYNKPILDIVNRTLTMWRWSGAIDPNANDPLLASTAWRIAPIENPESLLLGSQYLE